MKQVEKRALAAQERGDPVEARRIWRRAAFAYETSADALVDARCHVVALEQFANAARCYRAGASWARARRMADAGDTLTSQLPFLRR